MVNLAMEKQHLAQADRDIADGEQRIVNQVVLIERLRNAGLAGLVDAQAFLEQLNGTLQTWRDHRAGILSTIGSFERGEIVSRPDPVL